VSCPADVDTTGPPSAMHSTVAAEALHICDGCLATILCGEGSLVARWNWRHYSGKGWKLLLCPDCQPEAR
jgi:hypothetical protein